MRSYSAGCEDPTGTERRQMRNGRSFALWMAVFMVSFIGLRPVYGMTGWDADSALAFGLSLIPLVPGVLGFRAFMRLYRESDEMQREMLTEGIITGAALSMIFWGAVQLPEHIWLAKVKADMMMSVMCLGFSIGVVRARRRRS